MKNFAAYIQAIINNPVINKECKQTTTILMPELDTTEGIYRSILPSYVLNGLPDYRIIVTGITQKSTESNNARNFHITQDLINKSDHIVFPFVSFPLQPIIDEIMAVKPYMMFSYYIDFNYYLVSDSYPHADEYKGKMIDIIEANIKAVDQVIVTNKALKDSIALKLKEKHPDTKFRTVISWQPLFVLPMLIKTEYENHSEQGKIKVLIIGDEYQFTDINFIKGILKDFNLKYKENALIHIIGFNGVRGDKNFLSGLDFKYHERVPYFRYFELIKHIAPDVILIPGSKNTFNNTTKNYVKYLEFAFMNIPVLAPNIKPYSDLIETNRNGFLCDAKEDYLMQLEAMFDFRQKFDDVLGSAYAIAVDYDITIKANTDILTKIYFPSHEPKKSDSELQAVSK